MGDGKAQIFLNGLIQELHAADLVSRADLVVLITRNLHIEIFFYGNQSQFFRFQVETAYQNQICWLPFRTFFLRLIDQKEIDEILVLNHRKPVTFPDDILRIYNSEPGILIFRLLLIQHLYSLFCSRRLSSGNLVQNIRIHLQGRFRISHQFHIIKIQAAVFYSGPPQIPHTTDCYEEQQ